MMRIIEDLAGDWRRLDERIEGLSAARNVAGAPGSGSAKFVPRRQGRAGGLEGRRVPDIAAGMRRERARACGHLPQGVAFFAILSCVRPFPLDSRRSHSQKEKAGPKPHRKSTGGGTLHATVLRSQIPESANPGDPNGPLRPVPTTHWVSRTEAHPASKLGPSRLTPELGRNSFYTGAIREVGSRRES
jgi:hypothetical protein